MKTRQEAVNAARTWKGSPYRLGGRVKGAGVDCAMLLLGYLIEIEAIDSKSLENYGPYGSDWFHHTNNERYLKALMAYGKIVAETHCRGGQNIQPGNLVLFKVVGSKLYNHGAIVTAWPMGVHAAREGVCEIDLICDPLTTNKQMGIFDPWSK
jgi:cell wall-associated NlpC family hydrolase